MAKDTEFNKRAGALVVCLVFAALGSGCSTTTALPYQASTQNVIAAKRVLDQASADVKLGVFTAGPNVEKPTCRMMGELDVSPGVDIATYIRDAFEAELFLTERLADDGLEIRGQVQSVEVSSLGTGSWDLSLLLSSQALPQGYTVTATHNFSSSWDAVSACRNAATSFNPAVQTLLREAVGHPSFRALIEES